MNDAIMVAQWKLVRELLQHSSIATNQSYIKQSVKQVEDAIQNHIVIV